MTVSAACSDCVNVLTVPRDLDTPPAGLRTSAHQPLVARSIVPRWRASLFDEPSAYFDHWSGGQSSGALPWEAGAAPSDAGREHRSPGTGQFWESHWAPRHRQDQSLERTGDHGALTRLPGGVSGPESVAPPTTEAADAERRLARATTAFMDTVDASFMATHTESPLLTLLSAREAWLFETLLVSAIFQAFSQGAGRPADVPVLADALRSETGHLAAVRKAAERDAEALRPEPRALVSTTWAAWWLDHIADTDPQTHRD